MRSAGILGIIALAVLVTYQTAQACNFSAQGPVYQQCLASSGESHPQSRLQAKNALASCSIAATSIDHCSLSVSASGHQILGAMLGEVSWMMALSSRDLGREQDALQYYARARLIYENVLSAPENPDNIKAKVRSALHDELVEMKAYQVSLGLR